MYYFIFLFAVNYFRNKTMVLFFFAAGICWLSVNQQNGRCQDMLAIGMSQRECCGSGRATAGWTEDDQVSSGQLFYWRAFANGAPNCKACQGM